MPPSVDLAREWAPTEGDVVNHTEGVFDEVGHPHVRRGATKSRLGERFAAPQFPNSERVTATSGECTPRHHFERAVAVPEGPGI